MTSDADSTEDTEDQAKLESTTESQKMKREYLHWFHPDRVLRRGYLQVWRP